MPPLFITVAAVGAELSREQQPNLPITPDELARDAAACRAAGASIYHLHVRDASGSPTMDVETFRAAHEAITSETDLIVQFTTGGAVGDGPDARVAPLSLGPEMATLTTGSINFGDEVFVNPAPLIDRLYTEMRSHGTLPEFEIFDTAMIRNAQTVYESRAGDHHRHYDLVLGVPGALPWSQGVIAFLVAMLPPGATWSATGIGRAHLPVAQETIALGGHVRTGFEDVRYYEPGRLAVSNAELVERVVRMAERAGREIVGPDETREILGLGGTLSA